VRGHKLALAAARHYVVAVLADGDGSSATGTSGQQVRQGCSAGGLRCCNASVLALALAADAVLHRPVVSSCTALVLQAASAVAYVYDLQNKVVAGEAVVASPPRWLLAHPGGSGPSGGGCIDIGVHCCCCRRLMLC
jgi:hypothetical protein